jgi:hypothetical protein
LSWLPLGLIPLQTDWWLCSNFSALFYACEL